MARKSAGALNLPRFANSASRPVSMKSSNGARPVYDLDGGNVALIHGFKDYCALLFMKGALLKDPKGILVQQTKNVQAARQIRFASLADVNRQKTAVKAYIAEAIAVEKSGARVQMKGVALFDVPEEFQTRLHDDPKLAEAFHALTPGRQKGYLLHFAGAKQSATRAARVETHVPRILRGLGLDDPRISLGVYSSRSQ